VRRESTQPRHGTADSPRMSALSLCIEEGSPGARAGSLEPYADQDELVEDQRRAVLARVRAAIDHTAAVARDPDTRLTWPSALLVAESEIAARMHATPDRERFPMMRLRDRFALSTTEERVLWTLAACELSPLVRTLVRQIATEDLPDPTMDTIRRIAYGSGSGRDAWRELGEHGALRRFYLIERTDAGAEVPEHRRTWKVSHRVLALVHGELSLDDQLSEIARIDQDAPSLDDLEVSGDAARRVENALDRGVLIVVHGPAGHGRRSLLTAVAASRGLGILRVDCRAIAKDVAGARRQLRSIERECRLFGLLPLLCGLDALAATAESADRLALVEDELAGAVLATSARFLARRWQRPPTQIELQPLEGRQRAALWGRALPMASAQDRELLATMYPLAPALIETAGRAALEQCSDAEITADHITSGLRMVLDDRLAGLATRIAVSQTWDDLVLPDDQLTAIVELLARIRERRTVYEDWGFAGKLGKGLGVSALFSGPPGTGKTMAAGLIARALNTELYQVDTSKIVSKWIGETERNLAALFDAAEAGHAILLFDEADSLFGKRTDVRSSNDRHANQEINFLLQRLESYAGVCILTTNHETALDEAFRRRLSMHVRFPMPEADERARLWTAMIPASAPTSGDLRVSDLAATYVMSGGHIRNAVLRAAFLAANERGHIDAARLARAARLEYEAMGKIVSCHR
jgi:ATP-dependent 26S proteasome regulatory subunit